MKTRQRGNSRSGTWRLMVAACLVLLFTQSAFGWQCVKHHETPEERLRADYDRSDWAVRGQIHHAGDGVVEFRVDGVWKGEGLINYPVPGSSRIRVSPGDRIVAFGKRNDGTPYMPDLYFWTGANCLKGGMKVGHAELLALANELFGEPAPPDDLGARMVSRFALTFILVGLLGLGAWTITLVQSSARSRSLSPYRTRRASRGVRSSGARASSA